MMFCSNLLEDKNLPRVFGISGGRSSGLMAYLAKQDGLRPTDIFCFQNTGKEREETLVFIKQIESIFEIPVIWMEYSSETKFRIVNFETASRNGEPFAEMILKESYLPNSHQRICTKNLKVKVQNAYLKSIGIKKYNNYTGIRADEPKRIVKKDLANLSGKNQFHNVLPLVSAGITKEIVKDFWEKQPFNLQIHGDLGNCDLCFMKGKRKLCDIIRREPTAADWWIEQEKIKGATFHKDYSYTDLKHAALNQLELPIDWPEMECICSID